MWSTSVPWLEIVLRAAVIYTLLLVLIRVTGKRQVGQLAPFDLVLLLLLSNAVQNAMNGGDNSLTGGVVAASTLIMINSGLALATARSKRLEAIVEGRPQILVHHGEVDTATMSSTRVTHHELLAALRRAGCSGPEEVRYAVLETNGGISVIPKADGPHP